jgi:threonine/homoserine/homoserine lactone efflux protein
MQNAILISTILSVHILAWFTPGPLFVLIIRNSLVYSRKSGLWTAAGIAAGNFVHITYAVIGTFFVISLSSAAFHIITFLGACYLTYLGIATFLIKVDAITTGLPSGQKDITPLKAAHLGFTADILSPKASLFFVSIFSTVIASGPPFWIVAFLWITLTFIKFCRLHRLKSFNRSKHRF